MVMAAASFIIMTRLLPDRRAMDSSGTNAELYAHREYKGRRNYSSGADRLAAGGGRTAGAPQYPPRARRPARRTAIGRLYGVRVHVDLDLRRLACCQSWRAPALLRRAELRTSSGCERVDLVYGHRAHRAAPMAAQHDLLDPAPGGRRPRPSGRPWRARGVDFRNGRGIGGEAARAPAFALMG